MTATTYKRSILIINPNTTKAMTDALKPLVASLGYESTRYEYFTAPSGVPSINNESDAQISAEACLPHLQARIKDFDGFLVCCYSQHPLVEQLRREPDISSHPTKKLVAGIFEASLATCIQSLSIAKDHSQDISKFGIVSTGSQWKAILDEAVAKVLGSETSTRYLGTETTGLNADELHTTPKEEVDRRIIETTRKLVSRGANAICLGCAGMAGMDQTVRTACIQQNGSLDGWNVEIVDGVISGVAFLEGALRAHGGKRAGDLDPAVRIA